MQAQTCQSPFSSLNCNRFLFTRAIDLVPALAQLGGRHRELEARSVPAPGLETADQAYIHFQRRPLKWATAVWPIVGRTP